MRVLLSLWECFPRWDHKWQPCTLLLSWGEGLAMFLSCGHTVEHVALRLYWGCVPTRNERSATNNTNIYQPFQVLLTYHFSFSILGKLHIFYSFLGTLTKQETGNCGNCFKTGGVNPIPTSIFPFFVVWKASSTLYFIAQLFHNDIRGVIKKIPKIGTQ